MVGKQRRYGYSLKFESLSKQPPMCLILFAWKTHPDYRLIIAANRDEFHSRPTQSAHTWTGYQPTLIAGKDLQAGGTWLGVNQAGRFAAVTNFREVPSVDSTLSRGQLVTDYFSTDTSAIDYAEHLLNEGQRYAGFNLLLGDEQRLVHVSNRSNSITTIPSGVHGLSNALLNTPWPKVEVGKAQLNSSLSSIVNHKQLINLLNDQQVAVDELLPSTGINLDHERLLSSIKITSPQYGTRSSSSVFIRHDGQVSFLECRYGVQGELTDETLLSF